MTDAPSYRVLARKYRPLVFKDLIGQDNLVTVLTQAISTQRLPHAIILTGVRGVGKTTSARLIARALNCTHKTDTIEPCGTCECCKAILDDRLIDVIEMDAASRTGVDDIRSIIETAHYRPITASYKIFIIDEVHMLSRSAFNALLKTLEEPPSHVIFIFATTDIRKVPDTVLSRCINFNLPRLTLNDLETLLTRVLKSENLTAEPEALQLLARKADGSARDSLSLLDQAIHLSPKGVTASAVRGMLHLSDDQALMDIFKALVVGNVPIILEACRDLYNKGGDPFVLLQDLARLCYDISLIKSHPTLQGYTDSERKALEGLAIDISMPVLTMLWQGLLKGIQETESYPQPLMCTEMILLRLAHLSLLPSPHDVIETLMNVSSAPQEIKPPHKPLEKPLEKNQNPKTFIEFVSLWGQHKEPLMQAILRHDVELVSYSVGHVILRPIKKLPKDFISLVKDKTKAWTGTHWVIELTEEKGHPTLKQQEVEHKAHLDEETKKDPMVKEALALFPTSYIETIGDNE